MTFRPWRTLRVCLCHRPQPHCRQQRREGWGWLVTGDSAGRGTGAVQSCSECLSKGKPVLFINWFSGL